MLSDATLKLIFDRTAGHCHFCGDPLVLAKYGWKALDDLDGAWELDHVIQKAKGGSENDGNCLPACVRCNRLRWHRQGRVLRELLLLGLVAKDEIKKSSPLGKAILELKERRLQNNRNRRRNIAGSEEKRSSELP
jgi:5-methylcytosine-specific restriction endonuclease McrA